MPSPGSDKPPPIIRDQSIPLALRVAAGGAFVATLACGLAALLYLRRERGRQVVSQHSWAMNGVLIFGAAYLAAMAVILVIRGMHDVRRWRARRELDAGD